jgi:Na+-driven multidrug efflux pump
VAQGAWVASRIGIGVAAFIGLLFVLIPKYLLAAFGMDDPVVLAISRQLLGYLAVSGFFITVALSFTGALQGTGDTRGPLYISIVSQIGVPLGLCTILQATRGLAASDIWLAIVLGHMTRCALSVARFKQEKWRAIRVDVSA